MGPLSGTRVIELAGLGPAPFCAMLLSDLGAEVIRVDRLDKAGTGDRKDVINRGRRSIALNLKSEAGRSTLMRLLRSADVLIEGFRPGVMERLGLGPEPCQAENPRLIYGRMTGWGQHGPLSSAAGHDINYIALAGALHAMGDGDRPPRPPLNLVGDYGGGGMLLAVGVLAALLEAKTSGKGQVVDAAMTDGTALTMSLIYGLKAMGQWRNERDSNFIDGAAHYYRTYTCSDGKYIAVGALEPQFYAQLLEACGLDQNEFPQAPGGWRELSEKFARLFATRTRDEWCTLLEGSDACAAPVLDMDEAPRHPHNRARGTLVKHNEVVQPAPAPRFSRTETAIQGPPCLAGEHSAAILRDWGFAPDEIEQLKQAGEIPAAADNQT
jgi:alpha-methylacyl-CoA racemase